MRYTYSSEQMRRSHSAAKASPPPIQMLFVLQAEDGIRDRNVTGVQTCALPILMKKTVSVIGAGVAGLASAIRLQHAGYDVEIFEKESMPGGKMHKIEQDGYTFDLGPTIVMMPELYKEVFELCGRNPGDYIPMEQVDPMYRVYFNNEIDNPYDIYNDLTKLIKTIEEINEDDVEGFMAYLQEIYKRFRIAKTDFLQKPFRHKRDFYNPYMLKQGLKL